jgi:hypothetical protein
VVLDDKHPSTWVEGDLQLLCGERQRELQGLEYKRELCLESDGDKREVERDALAMANGGGGVIIYGIEETPLPDGGTAAGSLVPLADGSLYERLNSLLDDRGEPRLRFDIYPVDPEAGGFYLVVDISGPGRPYMGNDGRYHGRRGTSSRRMSEAEVADAYRQRFIREQRAMGPLFGGEPEPTQDDLPPDVAERIHRGLTPAELALWRDDTGEADPPGWMSVVVYPEPRRPRLLDPIRDRDRLNRVAIPERWDPDHAPLQYFHLGASNAGLRSQLPPRDDAAPAFLVAMYRDGVMEYGTILEPALRHEDPAENRIIFSASHPQQAHDYLQTFGVALGELGYEGPVAAQVSFDHTRRVRLGIAREYVTPFVHPIEDPYIRGDLWHLPNRDELLDDAGRIVKEVMDRVFLSGGIEDGFRSINDNGSWVEASR